MINQLETSEMFLRVNFDDIWRLKPQNRHIIRIYGREIEQPRWTQSYLQDYVYSGSRAKARALPDELKQVYEKVLEYDDRFNQILVNWYENGSNYIGAHSDDISQLIPNSPILSLSYGGTRKFRIRDKKTKKIIKDLLLRDRMCVIMKDDFQEKFTHEIVKIGGKKGLNYPSRINITFRCFNLI